jgi:hypothetical protein
LFPQVDEVCTFKVVKHAVKIELDILAANFYDKRAEVVHLYIVYVIDLYYENNIVVV